MMNIPEEDSYLPLLVFHALNGFLRRPNETAR